MGMNPQSEIDRRRKLILLQAGLLLLVVALCYCGSLSGDFLWDDDKLITENKLLYSTQGLLKIWNDPRGAPGEVYWPVTLTTFWIEFQAWGLKPFGYHVVNLLLHLTICLLVWKLLTRLGMTTTGAWLAAIIFGVHPVHVQSVAWIVERKDLLSTLFYLLAFLSYLRFDTSRRVLYYLLALVLFCLALLSKMVAITLPAALLLLFWMQSRPLNNRRDILPLIPFFLLALCMSGFFFYWSRQLFPQQVELSILTRCLLAGRIICHHVSKFLWPWPLVQIYSQWEINARIWSQYLFPLAVILSLAICAWRIPKWGRIPLAVLLFYILTLSPLLGFINFPLMEYAWVADRFQYLAMLAPIAGLVLLATQLQNKIGKGGRLLLRAVIILLCLVLSSLSYNQVKLYANMDVLFAHNVKHTPDHWLVRDNYGNGLKAKWHWREALTQYLRALELSPHNPTIHNSLGGAYAQLRESDLAIEHLEKAIAGRPDYSLAHYNLALILMWRNQSHESIEHFQQALEQNPSWSQPALNLARIMSSSYDASVRNGHQAVHYAEHANNLTGHRDPFFLDILAASYAEDGNFVHAQQVAEQAIEISRRTGMMALAVQLEKRLEGYKKKQPHRGKF